MTIHHKSYIYDLSFEVKEDSNTIQGVAWAKEESGVMIVIVLREREKWTQIIESYFDFLSVKF